MIEIQGFNLLAQVQNRYIIPFEWFREGQWSRFPCTKSLSWCLLFITQRELSHLVIYLMSFSFKVALPALDELFFLFLGFLFHPFLVTYPITA